MLALGFTLSALTGCQDEGAEHEQDRESLRDQPLALESGVTLNVTQDTSIRVSAPNKNFGNELALDVNRGLLKLDPSELASVVRAGAA